MLGWTGESLVPTQEINNNKSERIDGDCFVGFLDEHSGVFGPFVDYDFNDNAAAADRLGDKAIATARKVGQVEVDVGDTECKIPAAEVYIMKSRRGAPIAPKRKTVRC